MIRAGYLVPFGAMAAVTLGTLVAGQDAVTRYTTLVVTQNAVVTVTWPRSR